MTPERLQLIFTCEHASREVLFPERSWFRAPKSILRSHRGWDPGALEVARNLARGFDVRLFQGRQTRLLIELNRTEDHPQVFSEFARGLSEEHKMRLLEKYHRPYWNEVTDHLRNLQEQGPVLHLGIHSFTPVFEGRERTTELGLLFDPSRPRETELCQRWREEIQGLAPGFKVHFNRPYRGTGNGLITAFRENFSKRLYAGIEVEINQGLLQTPSHFQAWGDLLEISLRNVLKIV